MRRLALEGVFDADHAVVAGGAPGRPEIAADMDEDRGIDVLEHAGADIIGLGGKQFLGNARPQHQPALDAVLFHGVLQRQRGDDHQRHPGVMAFAMPRGAFDHRLDLRHARILRQPEQPVDVAAQCNHRAAFAPGGGEGGGNARRPARDLEAVLFKHVGKIFRGLDLLKPRLGIAEHLIDHHLRQLGAGIDAGGDFGLQLGARLGPCRRLGSGGKQRGKRQRLDRFHRHSPSSRLKFEAHADAEHPAQHIVKAAVGLRIGGRIVAGRAVADKHRIGVEQVADIEEHFALRRLDVEAMGDRRIHIPLAGDAVGVDRARLCRRNRASAGAFDEVVIVHTAREAAADKVERPFFDVVIGGQARVPRWRGITTTGSLAGQIARHIDAVVDEIGDVMRGEAAQLQRAGAEIGAIARLDIDAASPLAGKVERHQPDAGDRAGCTGRAVESDVLAQVLAVLFKAEGGDRLRRDGADGVFEVDVEVIHRGGKTGEEGRREHRTGAPGHRDFRRQVEVAGGLFEELVSALAAARQQHVDGVGARRAGREELGEVWRADVA